MTSSRNADAHGAVDHAVVERARDEPDVPHQDRAVDHHRPLGDAVDAEDGDLRVIHERRGEEPAQPAGARDGERRAAQLLRRERPGGGRGSQPRDLRRQLLDRLRRSVADDGDHEAGLGLHRHPEVDVVEVDDLVAVEAGVQRRMAAERLNRRAKDERQVAELAPGQGEVGEVALLDHGDGRHLAMRAGQMLGDRPPHAPQGLAPASRRPTGGRPHGGLGHRPVTGQRREVDAQLGGEPPHRRRGLHTTLRRFCHGRGCDTWSPVLGADHDEELAHRHDVALFGEDAAHHAGRRRRHLDGRLVGLDLDQQVVLGHLLAGGHEPADDLALGHPLAQVGHAELVGHQNAMTFVMASSTRSGDGR